MAMVAIDTLRLAKRLKEAGFSEPQAEAMADALKESREADLSQLVTKADLAAAVAELENRLMLRFGRMTAWAVGFLLAGIGAATTAAVALIRAGLPPHP